MRRLRHFFEQEFATSAGFDVKKKLKRFRGLIFALSVLISFCLVYPQNDVWAGIRFLSPNLTLRNFAAGEQEDLALDPPDQSKGIVPASSLNLSHLRIHPFQDSFPLFSQPFSCEQKLSVLRC
jgi:hypothetical protein